MSKPKLPSDPRDYYVHNECSLAELAQLYLGQKGCSLANLKIRSKKENWVKQLDQNYTETRLKIDQKLVEAKSTEISEHMSVISGLFGRMLANIANDIDNMGATIQDGEGFPNKYHQITWDKGLAAYLKISETKAAGDDGNGTLEALMKVLRRD